MTINEQCDNYLRGQLQRIITGQTITLVTCGLSYAFRTAAGAVVDKNLEYTEHPDDMPALVFFSGRHSSSTDGAECGMELHTQEYSIEGFIECNKDGDAGDDLRTDITAAVKADPWWGGLLWQELQNFETDVAIQNGDTIFAVVKVSFSAVYAAPYGSE